MNIKSWLNDFVEDLKGNDASHHLDFANGEIGGDTHKTWDDDGNLKTWERQTFDQDGTWRRVKFEVVQDD